MCIRDSCTNYGKLDMMWFDFSYDDLTGEAWRASELVRMVRSLQPDIIIDNRLDCLLYTSMERKNEWALRVHCCRMHPF